MLKVYIDSFIQLLFPVGCPGCGNAMRHNEQFLCVGCEIGLPLNPEIHFKDNLLKRTFAGRLPLETATALLYFTKSGIAQKLIHGLKYNDNLDTGRILGKRLALKMKETLSTPIDIIVPMPLHPKKEALRGYNQCQPVAEAMAEVFGCKVGSDVVARIRENTSQTRLNKEQRWKNVTGIFKLKNEDALAQKHVLLIDDTLTTGATIESCALEVIKAENVKISIAALAIAR